MSENEELVPQPAEFTNPKELDLTVNNAVEDIRRVEADPVAKAGRAAGELGFFAALGDIAKTHYKDSAGVSFKDVKAGVISFISLVPFAKDLTAPAKAMREANKAAYYAVKAEKALDRAKTVSEVGKHLGPQVFFRDLEDAALEKAIKAIPQGSKAALRLEQAAKAGYGSREALYIAEHGLPPRTMVEKGWRGIKHIVKTEISALIDPFPNVPEPLKKAAGVFDMVSFGSALVALFPPAAPVAAPVAAVSGMIGVGVPAAWQFIHNRVEQINISAKTQEKVSGLIKETVKKKLGLIKSPDVQKAASAFV